jgi:hypothetical protein
MNRELPSRPKSDVETYDTALDYIVDTRGISYDDARSELGEPPYELYGTEPAAKIVGHALKRSSVRRRRSGHGPQRGEEEGVGYPDGEPHYYQPHAPLTEDQAARNASWIRSIREELNRPHEDNNLE